MCLNAAGGVKSSDENAEGEKATTNNTVGVGRKTDTFTALTKTTATKSEKKGQSPLIVSRGIPSLRNPSQKAFKKHYHRHLLSKEK